MVFGGFFYTRSLENLHEGLRNMYLYCIVTDSTVTDMGDLNSDLLLSQIFMKGVAKPTVIGIRIRRDPYHFGKPDPVLNPIPNTELDSHQTQN
jgi:hypothetical protein